ncbi:hypothetical protein LZG00_02395 [Rhodobacteraceae bacterium LMO-12]|nr:hypothetical protein [Rhodobacteraceae bacterium LMO-JJ12]
MELVAAPVAELVAAPVAELVVELAVAPVAELVAELVVALVADPAVVAPVVLVGANNAQPDDPSARPFHNIGNCGAESSGRPLSGGHA